MSRGTVVAVCTSERKGTRKRDVREARLREEWSIEGDAHAGPWHRQVSPLAWEPIRKMRDLGLNVGPGSFAESITAKGINLVELPVGARLRIGETEIWVT